LIEGLAAGTSAIYNDWWDVTYDADCFPLDVFAYASGTGEVKPVIESISPDRGLIGKNVPVTIQGRGFGSDPIVFIAGTGVTVQGYGSTSNTEIHATFTIDSGATPGDHAVTVFANDQLSNAVNFFVQIPKKLRRDDEGSIVILDPTPGNITECEENLMNVCGAYRKYIYTLMDQDNPAQPIVESDVEVTEIFENYQGPGDPPDAQPTETEDGQLCDIIGFVGANPPNCPSPGSMFSVTQKFRVVIGSTTYDLTTVHSISAQKQSSTNYTITVTTQTP
jgi:hypothetical protein